MTKEFKPSKLQCHTCNDIIQSSYPGEWVCCTCFNNRNGTGCFVDSTRDYERFGGSFTVISKGEDNEQS